MGHWRDSQGSTFVQLPWCARFTSRLAAERVVSGLYTLQVSLRHIFIYTVLLRFSGTWFRGSWHCAVRADDVLPAMARSGFSGTHLPTLPPVSCSVLSSLSVARSVFFNSPFGQRLVYCVTHVQPSREKKKVLALVHELMHTHMVEVHGVGKGAEARTRYAHRSGCPSRGVSARVSMECD